MMEGENYQNNQSYSGDMLIDDAFKTRVQLTSSVFLGILAVIGICGNLLVIISILKFEQLRTVSHVFIFNLAIADLCFLLVTPIVILHSIVGSWIFGRVLCKFFLSATALNQFASAMFLAILSLDRYLAVCHPIMSTKYRKIRISVGVAILAWSLVCAEIVPMFLFANEITMSEQNGSSRVSCMFYNPNADGINANMTNFKKSVDKIRFSFTVYTFTMSYLGPLLCIWIFYSRIIYKMWQRRKGGAQFGPQVRRSQLRTSKRVTFMGVLIAISYTLCWMPFWVNQMAIVLGGFYAGDYTTLIVVTYFAYILQYVNAALNPFIYAFITNAFRSVITNKLYHLGISTTRTKTQHSHNTFEATRMRNISANSYGALSASRSPSPHLHHHYPNCSTRNGHLSVVIPNFDQKRTSDSACSLCTFEESECICEEMVQVNRAIDKTELSVHFQKNSEMAYKAIIVKQLGDSSYYEMSATV